MQKLLDFSTYPRNLVPMAFWSTKQPPALTEDLIEQVWSVTGRIKLLEDRFEERLDELAKRYRRAEQSEQRFEAKTMGDCGDGIDSDSDMPPALRALKERQGKTSNGMAR